MNLPLSLSEKSPPKRSRWPKIGDFNIIVMVNWFKTSLACIYLSRRARVMVIYHATRYRVYEKNQSPSDGELSHLLNLNLAATDWNKGGFWQDAVIMNNGNLHSTSLRCPKLINNRGLCLGMSPYKIRTNILIILLYWMMTCTCIFV